MKLLLDHVWIMFMAVTVINGLVLKYRSKDYIDVNPELKEGYQNLFIGWLLYASLPWIIMMIGDLSGITQSASEYFKPRNTNPMVLMFHLSLAVLMLLGIRWIYFKKGGEFLEKHPGLLRLSILKVKTQVNAQQVKLLFGLMVLGWAIGTVMMWK